jgi:hypothetical protein
MPSSSQTKKCTFCQDTFSARGLGSHEKSCRRKFEAQLRALDTGEIDVERMSDLTTMICATDPTFVNMMQPPYPLHLYNLRLTMLRIQQKMAGRIFVVSHIYLTATDVLDSDHMSCNRYPYSSSSFSRSACRSGTNCR